MDCNHALAPEQPDSSWYSHSDWSKGAQEGTPEGFPQDLSYMCSEGKGGGKGDSKGGKGPGNHNLIHDHFHMMMKARKGGGKGYSGTPYSGQQRTP